MQETPCEETRSNFENTSGWRQQILQEIWSLPTHCPLVEQSINYCSILETGESSLPSWLLWHWWPVRLPRLYLQDLSHQHTGESPGRRPWSEPKVAQRHRFWFFSFALGQIFSSLLDRSTHTRIEDWHTNYLAGLLVLPKQCFVGQNQRILGAILPCWCNMSCAMGFWFLLCFSHQCLWVGL